MKHIKKVVCSVGAAIALLVSQTIPNNVLISEQGLSLIGNAEECRLTPYVCPAGLATDGIGNTHGVTGQQITIEKVAIDWSKNIEDAQSCLSNTTDITSLTQGQLDAFVSFVFNVGCSRYRHNADGSETRIYKKIKTGQFEAACHELKHWVYAGGKKLNGLVKRRQRETALCLSSK